jgi:hypothetical protein
MKSGIPFRNRYYAAAVGFFLAFVGSMLLRYRAQRQLPRSRYEAC